VEIWKFDLRARLHGEQRRDETQILLRHLLQRRRGFFEGAFEKYDRTWRIRRHDSRAGDHLITFAHDWRGTGLWQLDASFDRRLGVANATERDKDWEEKHEAAAHRGVSLAAVPRHGKRRRTQGRG